MRQSASRLGSPGWARRLATLHEAFGQNLSLTSTLSSSWRSPSDLAAMGWGGVGGVSEFPKQSKSCLPTALASFCLSYWDQKKNDSSKNTKQQTTKTKTEQYSKPHQRSLLGNRLGRVGCLGTTPSSAPWSTSVQSLGASVSPTLPSFWATLLGWCE